MAHHLYVIMRLRPANSGIDMDQQLYGLLRRFGAQVTLLVPEAWKILNCIFHYPGSCLPSRPLFTGGCLITIPPPYGYRPPELK